MIPEMMNLSLQAIMARLKVLEEKVSRLEGNAPALPASGASGSLTPAVIDEEMGWITPKTEYGANVRKFPFYSDEENAPLFKIDYGQYRPVVGIVNDTKDTKHTWYQLEGNAGYVRTDVATFSDTPATPLIPSDRWPAPIAMYSITSRHHVNTHHGVDLATTRGTPIFSRAPGTVVKAFVCHSCHANGDGASSRQLKEKGFGYGSFVIVRYPYKLIPRKAQNILSPSQHLFVLFAHLQAVTVSEGFDLSLNQDIGLVGSTGDSSGPHVHIEVRYSSELTPEWWAIRGNEVDPMNVFSL